VGTKKRCKRQSGPDPSLVEYLTKDIDGLMTVDEIQEEMVVRTDITSINRATGVGGWPMRRAAMFHGNPQTGKTVLALAIAESLRRAGFIPVVYDTEFAAERIWYNTLAYGPGTKFKMPENYDEMVADIQEMLDRLRNARDSKKYADAARRSGYAFVVDTMTKLLPKEAVEEMRKKGVKRGYSLAAMWTSMWMKSMIPQLYRLDSTLITVVQERANIGAKANQPKTKPGGGEAIKYDISLRIKTTWAEKIKEGKAVVGQANHYRLEKNKVDGADYAEGTFFTSNGKGETPLGLDMVREAVEEGELRDLVLERQRSKEKWTFVDAGGFTHKMKGGVGAFRKRLHGDPELLRRFVAGLNRDAERKAEATE